MAGNDPSVTIGKRYETNPETEQNGHAKENDPTASTAKSHNSEETSGQSTIYRIVTLLQVWSPTLLLIFGGCCSNVYTLESLIHASPSSGPLITALQFLLTSFFTLPKHISYSSGWRNLYLKPRSIPLRTWLIYTAFFLTINMLNNHAFNYHISVPLHIILRSAGPVTTMAIGHIVGKRSYPTQKIIAVLLLFIGVVCAAVSDAYSKQYPTQDISTSATTTPAATVPNTTSTSTSTSSYLTQLPGFALLTFALLISALMGLYADGMYAQHGRSDHIASESLFYSHTLSLPFFATRLSSLSTELSDLTKCSPPISTYVSHAQAAPSRFLHTLPLTPLLLILNAGTQYLCISGVNQLSARSSSLTVGIVLNVRKLVSLLLSIWLFGNALPVGVILGAAIVFVGGGLYAVPTSANAVGGWVGGKEQEEKKNS